ncbi:serine-rich adhesin for platelets isoform X5 [Cherax quadricarinatus]|uniref:serine-rich adhesin for platelets isoform X5 n=1 Tax=Cherax quadricarinatus TaxID=27406 RepID=UPI002379E303|nr:nuclear pore complex protein DDB_G0274915-like isoform X5 [Cherax quadricarinatus]
MTFCLRPRATSSSSSSGGSDTCDSDEWFSVASSSSSSSSSSASSSSKVLPQESTYGSFVTPSGAAGKEEEEEEKELSGVLSSRRWSSSKDSTSRMAMAEHSQQLLMIRTKMSITVSSSSERGGPKRGGSLKRLLQWPLTLLRSTSGSKEAGTHLYMAPSYSGDLAQVTTALLHVFRTNTFPPEGLLWFHEKVTGVVMSGGVDGVVNMWRNQVVPSGTRMFSVRVASPRDGDRLRALTAAWHCLYTTTLPLLLALMAPLNSVGGCRCGVWSVDTVAAGSTTTSTTSTTTSTTSTTTTTTSTTTTTTRNHHHNNIPEELTSNNKDIVNDVLWILLAAEVQNLKLSVPVFTQLLHLHHGGHHHPRHKHLHHCPQHHTLPRYKRH